MGLTLSDDLAEIPVIAFEHVLTKLDGIPDNEPALFTLLAHHLEDGRAASVLAATPIFGPKET